MRFRRTLLSWHFCRVVVRYRLSTFGRRAFSVAGPTSWNSPLDSLRESTVSSDSFRKLLKRSAQQRRVSILRCTNARLTLTLTFLRSSRVVVPPRFCGARSLAECHKRRQNQTSVLCFVYCTCLFYFCK